MVSGAKVRGEPCLWNAISHQVSHFLGLDPETFSHLSSRGHDFGLGAQVLGSKIMMVSLLRNWARASRW